MEFIAKAPSHFTIDYNGYGIISRRKVCQRDERRNAELRTFLAFDKFTDCYQQVIDAASLADHCGQTTCQQRKEEDIRHP